MAYLLTLHQSLLNLDLPPLLSCPTMQWDNYRRFHVCPNNLEISTISSRYCKSSWLYPPSTPPSKPSLPSTHGLFFLIFSLSRRWQDEWSPLKENKTPRSLGSSVRRTQKGNHPDISSRGNDVTRHFCFSRLRLDSGQLGNLLDRTTNGLRAKICNVSWRGSNHQEAYAKFLLGKDSWLFPPCWGLLFKTFAVSQLAGSVRQECDSVS